VRASWRRTGKELGREPGLVWRDGFLSSEQQRGPHLTPFRNQNFKNHDAWGFSGT